MITETYLSFNLGAKHNLSETQKQALVRAFTRPPQAAAGKLTGRIRPLIAFLDGFGQVVIKTYFRGGIVRHVNRRAYLKTGKPRCRSEYETLEFVRSIGINAPMPVAFASRTRAFAFYHAWLVTKEIPGAETLAALSVSMPERAQAVLPEVATQVNTLIQNNILHVDLHPGNVLVDENDRTCLIDFDKARIDIKNTTRLAELYRRRWRRAVMKHQLPAFLETALNNEIVS